MDPNIQIYNQISSALLYFSASLTSTILNNVVLSSYGFPAFKLLSLGQTITIIVGLYTAKVFDIVSFPDLQASKIMNMLPFCGHYLLNMFLNVAASKQLSLSLYTAVRSFIIALTIVMEMIGLGERHSTKILIATCLTIIGAFVANNDEYYNHDYTFGVLSCISAAAYGVYIKKLLGSGGNIMGLMFYSSLCTLVPQVYFAYASDDVGSMVEIHYCAHNCVVTELQMGGIDEIWYNVDFQVHYFFSCVVGFACVYAVNACTRENSALTTAIIGCLKNIALIWLGLDLRTGDAYSWVNFVGMLICVGGCFISLYETLLS